MTMLGLSLPFDFDQPQWLWLCSLVPLLVLASLRSLAGLDPVRRVAALVVRSVLVILIAFCLAGIERVRRNDDLTVMFLMDRSHSVRELQDDQEAFIRGATQGMPAEDRVGLIDFARHAFLQQLPMRGGFYVPPGRLPTMQGTDRTDIASAMRLAMAMFPHDAAKRIVLMSDGNDNLGDLMAEARRAKADGIPVDVVPLRYLHRNEVYFDRLIAPAYAEPGELVPLRMVVHTERHVSGTLHVYRNGEIVELPPDQAHVELVPGDNTFMVKLLVESAGPQTYKGVFRADDDSMDANAMNNTASAFTFVSGKSSALLISSDPTYDIALVEALRRENVRIDMKTIDELGEFGLLQMMSYSTIILANVPAAAFTDEQQEALTTFVKDVGSGLIMLGGDEGFGAGGWIGSPVEEVMPVTFEIKHKRVIPRGALVLIMHSCEIPRGNYWGKEMAKRSVDTISSQDYIGVLAYTYSPGGENWEVPLGLSTNKAAVKARIDRMQIGDMPTFDSTMRMAYRELTSGIGRDAAQKHVIILSDGDAQAPASSLLDDYKRAMITVSTIGIGWGAHVMDRTLIQIAKRTGGRYYTARNPRQLPQIFSKESKVIRRPLIIDEPFKPQVLHSFSPLLAGIGGDTVLPVLGGMVLTSPKQSPNVVIPIIRPTKDGEDPVLVHWQYELGKAVAFTSGYWPRWGAHWTEWAGFGKLWAQIVRWTMRQDSPANFDTYTTIEGNRGRIVIDAIDKNANYLNLLQPRAKIIGPNHTVIPVRFVQTGPGHYEASFEVDVAGQYLANVHMFDHTGAHTGTIRTGLTVPFSPEYRDMMPNEAMLRQVAEVTGGRWLDGAPEDSKVFSHDLPPTKSRRPAWEWVLAWLLLPLFLLDVAVRRLASWLALSIAVEVVVLFVLLWGLDFRYGWGVVGAFVLAELVGWTIRFRYIGPLFDYLTHGVVSMRHTGERSAAALDHLKGTRERVRDDLSADKEDGPRRIADTTGVIDPKRSKTKYQAPGGAGGAEAGDLSRALGGAEASVPKPGKSRGSPADGEGAEEDMTSRLLRARRKTRGKRDEENE